MLIQQAGATAQRVLCMRQPSAVCAAQPHLSLHDTLARFFPLAAGMRCHLWPCKKRLAQMWLRRPAAQSATCVLTGSLPGAPASSRREQLAAY